MKKFTKLALVSSLAISANAMAMQAMDDASLGATTGQDGINIGIGISKIEIEKLYIHDNDGLTAAGVAGDAGFGGTGTAGAIVIKGNGTGVTATKGIVIGANYDNAGAYLLASRNLADLQIDSDAGTIRRGGKDDAGADQNYNAILSGLSLKTGQMTANIQLGAAPQGAMIKLNTKMVGGLEIKNLGILDNSTKQGAGDGTAGNRAAGEIFVNSIKVADANSTDLTIKQSVSVVGKEGASNGYIRMISSSGPIDTYVKGVHLGSRTAGSIGDVEVQGLQTYFSPALGSYVPGSVITISGR